VHRACARRESRQKSFYPFPPSLLRCLLQMTSIVSRFHWLEAKNLGPEGLPEISPGRKPGVGQGAGLRPGGAAASVRPHVLPPLPGRDRVDGSVRGFRCAPPPANFWQALRANFRQDRQARRPLPSSSSAGLLNAAT
jgi:hypothetical protein